MIGDFLRSYPNFRSLKVWFALREAGVYEGKGEAEPVCASLQYFCLMDSKVCFWGVRCRIISKFSGDVKFSIII